MMQQLAVNCPAGLLLAGIRLMGCCKGITES
ncbi:hypothetical protein C810_04237 [Lachnospiraceae bacterium A2]|nr:hypothetical protein C810_04237 [Lachnospiraceae bacterium A2]